MNGRSPAMVQDAPPCWRSGDTKLVRSRGISGVSGQVSATHAEPWLHQQLRAAASAAMTRYRIHVGDLIIDLRHHLPQSTSELRAVGQRAMLLLPLIGPAEIITEALTIDCAGGTPMLFARDEPATAIWHAPSWGLAIHLQRDRLNATASAALGDARRLQSIAAMLPPRHGDRALEDMAERLVSGILSSTPQQGYAATALEQRFYEALAGRLIAQDNLDTALAPIRSIGEAIRIIRADHRQTFDTDSLAAAAGVTAQTLRKGFKSCLGMSVKEFIETVRLDWAHGCLVSCREGRPIAEIAKSAGFRGGPPFSRAYLKRFGEPPSQTRARAVHMAGG